MSPAKPHATSALLASSLLVVLTAAPGANGACNATCRRDLARCMATQCARVGRAACRTRCKPAAIRTLAYVLSECREDAAGFVGHQALRIRRGDREPITVVEFSAPEPTPDPLRVCLSYGLNRSGELSLLNAPLERLGVSPDGSGVVFEVTDEHELSAYPPFSIRLSPDQRGMFFIRSDGRGLRCLGPASRDPSFRFGGNPQRFFGITSLNAPNSSITFSPNGRRIAFTDRGPGPGGEETVQIIVLDLATAQRTQVTCLPADPLPASRARFPPTDLPTFINNETVLFFTQVNVDGSNPEHDFTAFTVRVDGSCRLKPLPRPIAPPGSHVVQTFAVVGRGTSIIGLGLPGTPVNPCCGLGIFEVGVQDGKNLLQLTNFRRVDTSPRFLDVTRTRAFFTASAPSKKNPYGNCQMFSIDTLGSGLRQVTHFNPGRPVGDVGCFAGPPGCGFGDAGAGQDPVTKAVVFESSCDPVHANHYGDQLFAMRPDGLGLRQLTDASGFTNPDGGIRVELPGPFAYSALLH